MQEQPRAQTTTAFDPEALRRAVEGRDAQALTDLFTDDAVLRLVDKRNPPKTPAELRGKQAIGAMLAEISAREMTHHVDQEMVSDDALAYTESCEYPDGLRVLSITMAKLRDGKITEATEIQAWDE